MRITVLLGTGVAVSRSSTVVGLIPTFRAAGFTTSGAEMPRE